MSDDIAVAHGKAFDLLLGSRTQVRGRDEQHGGRVEPRSHGILIGIHVEVRPSH
jgi:hypothetical protein